MAAQNGIAAANAAMHNANGNVVLSSPGYHSDMQVLMENMEKLSGTLQRNRQEWAQVQDGLARVERLQGRLAREGQLPLVNGDSSSHDTDSTPTVLQLQNELATAHRQIADLREAFTQLQTVHEEYAKGLETATQLAREFESQEQTYLQSVHKHYSDQLLQARNETIEAQLTHQAWQARLQKLDETVKKAYEAREEEGLPYRRRLAALREENRILRSQVGWAPRVDESDEEEEEEFFGEIVGRDSSRAGVVHGEEERERVGFYNHGGSG